MDPHHFHALTDRKGRFRIRDVPEGGLVLAIERRNNPARRVFQHTLAMEVTWR